MKPLKFFLAVILIGGLNQTNQVNAQSDLIFENVIQRSKIFKPHSDSSYTYNFEYLSGKQAYDFGWSLKSLLNAGVSDKTGFHLFYDLEETDRFERTEVRRKLIIVGDSVEQENYDANGNPSIQKVAGNIDSIWFFEGVRELKFKEDWIIDTAKFTCEIRSKMFIPLVLKKGKEDLGPMEFVAIKPGLDPKSFKLIADMIITDVYVKQDPMTEDEITIREANTEIDFYKMVMFINSTIDKIKAGKLPCFKPTIPAKKQITTVELKTMFTDEYVINKKDKFPVRFKMYNFRFKMIQKWWFDPIALAFKKEAVGMVLMKRNEKKDFSKNKEGSITYTFKPVAYVPFNK